MLRLKKNLHEHFHETSSKIGIYKNNIFSLAAGSPTATLLRLSPDCCLWYHPCRFSKPDIIRFIKQPWFQHKSTFSAWRAVCTISGCKFTAP